MTGPSPVLVASRYITVAKSALPGTSLAFNAFTGALLELDEADHARVASLAEQPGRSPERTLSPALRERLVSAGILVPEGFDERAAVLDIRRRALAAPDALLLTLAPTIQCNLRCTYCFETHRQEEMTPAVEADLSRFIAHKVDGVRAITTTWFGGEPLLRPDVIERVQLFINSLGEARGLEVSRGIVTNGFFLDDEMVRRLLALGSWDMAQVTLDGLPEVHDTRRILRGGQGTWERIVRNCRTAVGLGFPISLRVNVDRRNVESLPDLLDRLIEEGVLPGAAISLGFVVDSTAACAHVKADVLTDEDRARISIRFDAELLRRDLLPDAGLPSPLCGPMCSVESKLGFVVAPSGLIFKCWNQIDASKEHAIGHVSGAPVPNAPAELARWTKYDPALRSGCSSCKALPTCMGGCPWEYERLGRVDHGECDSFRFFPEEVVTLAHLRMRVQKTNGAEVPVARPQMR